MGDIPKQFDLVRAGIKRDLPSRIWLGFYPSLNHLTAYFLVFIIGSIAGKRKHGTDPEQLRHRQSTTRLAAIAKKLESIDALQKDVAALKSQSQNRDRSGNGSRKQDEGNHPGIIKGIVHIIRLLFPPLVMETHGVGSLRQKNISVTMTFQKKKSVKQTGTVQEYRQEFAKRSLRVSNWLEHCLLGVFLNGLKEELKADVRIQKPRTVYKAVEKEKIDAVQSWPIPSNVKEVRGFSWILRFLSAFYKKLWVDCTTLDCSYKEEWTFVVECDASSAGVGAILSQEEHPIAYFSKGFSPSNRFKSAYDRELLALVLAVQKWNHYLLGRHFLIRTDHYTLKFLLEQRITTTEQQRLLLKLMPYDFSISHRAGKENKGADALSRRPHSGELLTLSVPYCVEIIDIKRGRQQDYYSVNILQQLQDNPSSVPDFYSHDQLLFFKGRLVIPDIPDLKLKLLQECHNSPAGGHGGFLKTFKRLSLQFFWPRMKQEIRVFVPESA
ncbi:ty3-gypsy retrotransposon protein [Tanacetum coccineum]